MERIGTWTEEDDDRRIAGGRQLDRRVYSLPPVLRRQIRRRHAATDADDGVGRNGWLGGVQPTIDDQRPAEQEPGDQDHSETAIANAG